ncbi:MAG: transglycosylase SLT domain-containing protein [Pseudomonadota bacterium]
MRSALLIFSVLLFIALPACAHESTKTASSSKHNPENSTESRKPDLSALNEVVLGLSDFEKRAKNYEEDEWNFVLGYVHFMHSRWEAAEHYLNKAEGKLPSLSDYVLYYLAYIANELGQFSKALNFLDALKTQHPESVWISDAKIQRAISLAGLGSYSEAQNLLSTAHDQAPDEAKADIERLIAHTYIKANDATNAIEYVKSMALACGSERDLDEISDLIDEVKRLYRVDVHKWLNTPSNLLILAESFAADSQWADVASRLEKLLARTDIDSSLRTRAKWLLAKAYRWTHRYDESIALMEELRRSPAGQRISDLSVTLATVYAKKNDYDKAIAIRNQILKRLPPGSQAYANVAYKIAFLYVDENKYAQAIPLWQQIASMRSAGTNRIIARWYIGWSLFMLKDYEAALKVFEDLIKRDAKSARIADRVMYWKGRALINLGRHEQAREAFSDVLRKYPRGYYAELARRRLNNDNRELNDFAKAGLPADGLVTGESGEKFSTWKPNDIREVSSVPHMQKALELDRLGLHEEVARELRATNNDLTSEAAEVALWLAWKNFAHDIAYRLAQRKFRDILKYFPSKDGFARFVWEQAYPKAYDPIVKRLKPKGDIDSMLVWSIMRNESAFRPRVISPAGAVGLMQLMPTTAGLMAKDLGEGKVSVKDLYKPGTNIAYGITYLNELSNMFPGNAVAIIASYNAGEQAVARWLKNGSFKDIEEWIEEIPYSETNLYVKKVLTSYWGYQRLYNGEKREKRKQSQQRVTGR